MVSPNYLEDDPVDLYPASTGAIDEEDPATAEILAEQRRRQLKPMPANGVAGVMAPKAGVPPAQTSQDPSALVGAIQRVSDIRAARPELPKPKWWQQAIAGGVGALAGASNARGHAGKIDPTEAIQNIKYPGYAQRLQNWQQQLGGAQAQQEAEQAKLSVPAEIREKNAKAQQAEAEAEYYKGRNEAAVEGRREAANVQGKARQQATAEQHVKNMLKGREEDSTYQKEGDPVPQGYEVVQDIANPGYVYVVPPARVAVTEDLAQYLPGRKVGQVVPWSEFKRAQAAAQQNLIKNENKPAKGIDAVQLAIRAAGGNPEDPASITPEVAKRAAGILKPAQPGVTLTPEAMDFWAKYAGQTGQVPSLGMGNAGANARSQILNRAPQVAGGDVAGNRAAYHADAGSLASMQKMRDAVVSFEKTAGANMDILLNQAKGIVDTGSPLLNQPLRAINRTLLGSKELAAYDAARRVAINEVAKVTSNPTLAGQLSDAARREVENFNPASATLGQTIAVARILRQDMANRHKYLDQGLAEIRGRLNPQQQTNSSVATERPPLSSFER